MDTCLLTVIVAPAIEDAVVDWLLEQDVAGFTSMPVRGHGASPRSMALGEQVTGRSHRVMFQAHLDCDAARALAATLAREFEGSGIHYWLTPVLEGGHLE